MRKGFSPPRSMSQAPVFREMRAAAPAVLPSLLMCDFGHLADEVARLEATGVPALHLDVMDGHFVPNLSYGLTLVEAFRRMTELPLDVHLMIANPTEFAARYVEAGANHVTIHVEAAADPRPILDEIHAAGASAGVALNPPTPVSRIEPLLDACEVVLVMSVMPGFGGQEFDRSALAKLRTLRQQAPRELVLAVDGGVNHDTIAECASAGAELFVVGSAIFHSRDYTSAVRDLRARASKGRQEES
jgi:ribulose-phosphate 3-epimerase